MKITTKSPCVNLGRFVLDAALTGELAILEEACDKAFMVYGGGELRTRAGETFELELAVDILNIF